MSHVTVYDVRGTGRKIMEVPLTTAEQLYKENKILRAHCLNMLGKLAEYAKLDRPENFIPRMSLDLASSLPLEFEDTPAGSWIRRKITHHNMGS